MPHVTFCDNLWHIATTCDSFLIHVTLCVTSLRPPGPSHVLIFVNMNIGNNTPRSTCNVLLENKLKMLYNLLKIRKKIPQIIVDIPIFHVTFGYTFVNSLKCRILFEGPPTMQKQHTLMQNTETTTKCCEETDKKVVIQNNMINFTNWYTDTFCVLCKFPITQFLLHLHFMFLNCSKWHTLYLWTIILCLMLYAMCLKI